MAKSKNPARDEHLAKVAANLPAQAQVAELAAQGVADGGYRPEVLEYFRQQFEYTKWLFLTMEKPTSRDDLKLMKKGVADFRELYVEIIQPIDNIMEEAFRFQDCQNNLYAANNDSTSIVILDPDFDSRTATMIANDATAKITMAVRRLRAALPVTSQNLVWWGVTVPQI